ncbi:asparagine synthase-related protein [Candidatus Haliotispira prima]|uniref:asparagine synthase (glutamine-hydrolyzing) n=1 Tax=Candidatus Haliotispira prima TaxID=3034016 RepID=A0ABY8MGR2_9SPIO|nr:asparagine synthase-related protein [Candidatus Haliotispira prima]
MCGFIGYFGENPTEKISEEMIEGIFNRGEVTEEFLNDELSIVVRRLKIVDRENAIQPFISDDKRYILIYNGEIYNDKEMRKSLLREYNFLTNSDTETLFAMLILYGKEHLKLLNGQFSFVFFDLKKKSFISGRDHLGVTPLYYTRDGVNIYFASTIKALTPINKEIRELEPGCTLTNNLDIEKYYEVSFNPVKNSPESVIGQVRSVVVQAIKNRIATDLPIGVIYSGGIDSSIVLHIASQYHKNVTAFTIGTKGSEDFAISKKFCLERNIPQVIISLDPSDLSCKAVRDAIKQTELTEYLDIINAVVTLPLFREINKRGIKVTLSGDGSDELFCGYDMYDRIRESDETDLYEYKLKHLGRTELQRVDRAAGNYQVENRVPFLDINVVEMALRLEKKWKINKNIEKWCLRKAFENELPEYIHSRVKNPLSHSSGFHEIVRYKKILFKRYYNQCKYTLHDNIKRDFSITLKKNHYKIQNAFWTREVNKDYSMLHKIGELIKGFSRVYIISSVSKKEE